jgi:hypothetical protein
MQGQSFSFGRVTQRRALAILCCLALLYLAAGGTGLHQHTSGSDTPCHICQALHMPALEAARLDLVHRAAPIAWHTSAPLHATPSGSFDLHRASRAPPSA